MPFRLSSMQPGTPRSAPATGQDNALVYGQWLGYDASNLEQLQANGTI
jgi:crotonobetainyl-CoA:carnitine CoA-transferase CaiB-like acyl-CoA transferase